MAEVFTHRRAESFEFTIDDLDQTLSPSGQVQVLTAKLKAEQERLLRMLPVAPRGYWWEATTERFDDVLGGSIKFRVVYRLKEI